MEDDLKKNKNGRRPKKKQKNFSQLLLNLGATEDDLKKIRNGRRPKKKSKSKTT